MRTGVIVYVVGDTPVREGMDFKTEVKKLEPQAVRVEVVGRDSGHFDIEDAWWSLTAKGMQRIVCMVGETNATGSLHLGQKTLRLCG